MRSCHPRSVSFPPRRTANGTFQAQSEASKSCWPTKMSASVKDGKSAWRMCNGTNVRVPRDRSSVCHRLIFAHWPTTEALLRNT